jgi:hypothetical protein
VHDVRSLSVAASLAALFVISLTSTSNAASAYHSANVTYSSANGPYSSSNSNMSRAEEPVPANCIRQSCGKLWCWQMNGSKSSGH